MRGALRSGGGRKARHFLAAAVALLAVCLPLAGCSPAAPRDDAGPDAVRIATTTPPLADWARQVAGPDAVVTCILPPGSNAHTFEPSPREMRSVAEARVLLRVGLQLDEWGKSLADANRGIHTVALGDELRSRNLLPDVTTITAAAVSIATSDSPAGDDHAGHDHAADTATTGAAGDVEHDHAHDDDHDHATCSGHAHDGTDPHFWLDPLVARECVRLIADHLAAAYPARAAEFRANAARYGDELKALDGEIREALAGAPRRDFATFHNAFAYYASRYGLTIAAVIEEYPGKEPGDRYLKGVVGKLREAGIRRVFAEPQFSRRAAEIIAREIGGKVEILDPHGSPDVPERANYLDLMRFNTRAIAGALSDTPAAP